MEEEFEVGYLLPYGKEYKWLPTSFTLEQAQYQVNMSNYFDQYSLWTYRRKKKGENNAVSQKS